jgi:hypothetical protein
MDKPQWDDLKDLRGDMWCHCILALISIFIAGTALTWLVIQQGEISHLTNQVSHLSHSRTRYAPAQP